MTLLGSTKSKITKNESRENMPYLEIIEVALFHCNNVNNYYQKNLRMLYRFIPGKSFGQLFDISLKKFRFLNHLF